MRALIRIAARNLIKNGRRSFFTIFAISLGYAAVNVFGSFTNYMFTGLKDAYIYGQANGHLTVFKRGFLTEGKLDPAGFLITQEVRQEIERILVEIPQVLLVTPQLYISGLISNGEVSTIFVGIGRVPSDVQAIQNKAGGLGRRSDRGGGSLRDDLPYGIGLSSGLADQLNRKEDSDVIVMSPTVFGQINALDAHVLQVFDAPSEALNDKLVLAPLTFVQSLYETTSVDRLTVLLEHTNQTEEIRTQLVERLSRQGLDVEIKTWEELASFYSKVKKMFDLIFLFLFGIVFIIATMSVINTISMTVMERTREIGTMRALGLKRRGILVLFTIESAFMGILGSGVGFLLTAGCRLIVNTLRPTWIPPMLANRVAIELQLVPSYLLVSVVVLVGLSIGVAALAVRRTAHMKIIDALGHA